jgi:hypothetical protein
MFQTWNDYNLRWDPEEYGNITSLRVTAKKIWIPGIFYYK